MDVALGLRLTRLVAWALLAAIAFVTLGPIADRPSLSHDPQIERFAAFFVVGALFACAYPRRRLRVAVGVAVCALALEAAQTATADRHGAPRDALAKVVGGLLGVLAARGGSLAIAALRSHERA